MEVYLLIPLLGGTTIAALAWLWLIARAFQQGAWWGLGCLLLPPLALWFAVRHAQQAVKPLVWLVAGGAFATIPALYLLSVPVAPELRAKLGERPMLWTLASTCLRSEAVHEWMETRAFYLQVGGVAVAVLVWLWLIVLAFRQGRAWGWGSLLVPPVGLVFAGRHPRKGTAPLIVLVLGLLAAAAPAVYMLCVPLDLAEHVRMVNGRRHVTLTGWDRKDYSLLGLMPDVSVLQMANPDVTDEVLEKLRGMKALKELDLNGTSVTDAGLGVLRDLPALETLWLARTRITDKGFHDAISSKDSLMQIDLRGTSVSRDSTRAWREANPERKVLQ